MLAEALARIRAIVAGVEPSLLSAIFGVVPGLGIDAFLASLIIGALMVDEPSADPDEDRRRPLEEWKPRIRAKLGEWREAEVSAGAATVALPLPVSTPDAPALPPSPAPTPPAPAGTSGALIPLPPPGLPEPLREAWIQARTRAGDYARGLGDVIRQWPEDVQREDWAGEDIATEVDADARRAKREIIRTATAEAVEKRWTPERLASEFGHKTQEWSRNWMRIARTELQQAHNEGVGIMALRADGEAARVARIPEAGACPKCLELFTEDGLPRIFSVVELLDNGTNVGKRAVEWVATLGPLHPNCRCSVQYIPEGMTLDARGWLVAA